MWCCSILLRRGVVACVLLALAASVTRAQERDETWVIAQITAGKFEELRSLEKLSDRGVPFAMYWWGFILERCIFERCDKDAARELILRSGDCRPRSRADAGFRCCRDPRGVRRAGRQDRRAAGRAGAFRLYREGSPSHQLCPASSAASPGPTTANCARTY